MKTGKAAMQDPRMAPGKAPTDAPDATHKTMPEYPMDDNELVYPGEGSPFSATRPGPEGSTSEGDRNSPAHPAEPLTEVPRERSRISGTDVHALMQACIRCITACERCGEECRHQGDMAKFHLSIATNRACADMCTLLHSLLGSVHIPEIARMAKDMAAVTARACDSCALACGHHPDMDACVSCTESCRQCAAACRKFANA
jgi:hypothetical protein